MEKKYRGVSVKEGWFILTNLGSLSEAIATYQKRMGIEEMFRDYKKRRLLFRGDWLKRSATPGINSLNSTRL